MPEWLVIGLESGVHWPTTETTVTFEGNDIVLRPETDRLAPSIALRYDGERELALALARRFLSSLAWVEEGPLREIGVTGGTHPFGIGKGPGAKLINPKFRIDYLPAPEDSKTRLALAVYREARGVNSVPYQFLGFYKIINIVHARGEDQVRWINVAVNHIDDHIALQRLAQIRTEVADVGRYLYISGRCAVAHAYSEPVVDPDEPADTRRLARDLLLMRRLAEYCIEHDLGVKRAATVLREHLYELEGFRKLLGEQLAAMLKAREAVSDGDLPALPRISIGLRDHTPFSAFSNLRAEVAEVENGTVIVRCRSEDDLVIAAIELKFPEERLRFRPEEVSIADDGTAVAASRALDRVRFIKELYGNAEVVVVRTDDGTQLGRCDPFIPVNVDLGETDRNLDSLAEWIAEEMRRREACERATD
jgi:hypothetical protein